MVSEQVRQAVPRRPVGSRLLQLASCVLDAVKYVLGATTSQPSDTETGGAPGQHETNGEDGGIGRLLCARTAPGGPEQPSSPHHRTVCRRQQLSVPGAREPTSAHTAVAQCLCPVTCRCDRLTASLPQRMSVGGDSVKNCLETVRIHLTIRVSACCSPHNPETRRLLPRADVW